MSNNQLGNQNALTIPEPSQDHTQEFNSDIPNAKSKFKQQRLPACRPFLTPLSASIVYLVFFVVSLVFGLVYLKSSHDIFELEITYSDKCDKITNGTGNICTFDIQIDDDVKGPIYIYYQLTNFYQNNFLYGDSKNWDQLRGKKYINLIPNAADIQHKVFSIENPIPATYIGFKSINSLNFGMALFFFRMKTLHQFKNATFFTPEPHLKYIRYLYNQTPKYPQNYLDFHSNCLDLDDGNNVNYFNFVGFADENSINKITGNFQIVDNYSDVNEEENEELDILSDINERCFFNGMF